MNPVFSDPNICDRVVGGVVAAEDHDGDRGDCPVPPVASSRQSVALERRYADHPLPRPRSPPRHTTDWSPLRQMEHLETHRQKTVNRQQV